MNKNQKGSLELVLLIIFTLLWVIAGVAFFVYRNSHKEESSLVETSQQATPSDEVKVEELVQ